MICEWCEKSITLYDKKRRPLCTDCYHLWCQDWAEWNKYFGVVILMNEIRPVYIPFTRKIDYYELVIPLTKSTKKKYFKKIEHELLEGNT